MKMTNKNILYIDHSKMPFQSDVVDVDGICCLRAHSNIITTAHTIKQIHWGQCAVYVYDSFIHPFIAPPIAGDITGLKLIDHLSLRWFKSNVLTAKDLDASSVACRGYNPGSNDEIHNDDSAQYIFHYGEYICDDPGLDQTEMSRFEGKHNESAKRLGQLKKLVVDEKLWYLLLHTEREKIDEDEFSDSVVLMAVGQCILTGQLIGVITANSCHNVCD